MPEITIVVTLTPTLVLMMALTALVYDAVFIVLAVRLARRVRFEGIGRSRSVGALGGSVSASR